MPHVLERAVLVCAVEGELPRASTTKGIRHRCWDRRWPIGTPGSVDGRPPALPAARGFMTGRKEILVLNARNQGSATAGICDESCISNTMEPDR